MLVEDEANDIMNRTVTSMTNIKNIAKIDQSSMRSAFLPNFKIFRGILLVLEELFVKFVVSSGVIYTFQIISVSST